MMRWRLEVNMIKAQFYLYLWTPFVDDRFHGSFWCIYYVWQPIGMQHATIYVLLSQIYCRPNLISAFKDMTFHPQITIIIINHTGWVHTTDWNTGCVKVAAEICRKHDFIIYPFSKWICFFFVCFCSNCFLFSLTQSRMSVLLFANKTFIFVHSLKSRGVWWKKAQFSHLITIKSREQSGKEVERMRWKREEELQIKRQKNHRIQCTKQHEWWIKLAQQYRIVCVPLQLW